MAHPLFGPEIRQMQEENDLPGMKAFCETIHPATVAESLAGDFTKDEVWRFLQQSSIRIQAAIFEYFPLEWQVEMVGGVGQQHMARLIEKMSHDDRVDLLRRLRPRVAEQLLRLVDEADRRDIAALTAYPEHSAGAIMTTDYAWLPANISVADAIERMRLQAPDRETIYYIYVLDDQRRLLGVVSLRNLILASRHSLISEVMEKDVVSVKALEDQEVVAREMARYDLIAIPVVDKDDRLVGIITHDDVIDVVVKEATEDVQRLGGVGALAENYMEVSFVTIWRKRAFWLSCLFVAELATFNVLAYFDDAIKAVVVLSMFIPLCLSTGGNSGSQAATLITRAMALGHVGVGDWFKVLKHELLMGLVLGITLGAIGYGRVMLVTKTDVLDSSEQLPGSFHVRVPLDKPLSQNPQGKYELPANSEQHLAVRTKQLMHIDVPGGASPRIELDAAAGMQTYYFPAECTLSFQAVSRWDLAIVIALSVALICLWGTIVGSLLPLVFRAMGFDPAFASSPFVATFVDVTGIAIYFNISKLLIPALSTALGMT